ncbi:MAG: SIMPL domain-containing protein [Gemmatimonadaceae bacterium]
MKDLMRYQATSALAALCLASGAFAQAPTSTDALPVVETVGTGERRVAPDRATVMLVVESRAEGANAAAAANARAVQAVRDTLAHSGLDSAVTTAGYHVGVRYEPVDRGAPRQAGYVARTALRVRPQRIDQVGRVIDVGLASGATGVEGVYFESSRMEEARREAMNDASAAARRDAESLARALGGSLGRLISVSTVGSMDPRRLNMTLAGGTASALRTLITPNEIVVHAAVETRWQFIPR